MSSVEEIWSIEDMPPPAVLTVVRPTRYDPLEERRAAQRLREAQAAILYPLFEEAYEQPKPLKYKNGSHVNELTRISAVTKNEFDQVGGLDPEYLYPEHYRNGFYIDKELPDTVLDGLRGVRTNRRLRLQEAGRKWCAESRDIMLPPGLLDVPPYCRQGDNDLVEHTDLMGCVGTSFRMVYAAVTGTKLSNLAVSDAMWPLFNQKSAPDEFYLNVLASNGVQEMSDAKVTPITIGGADLVDISALAARLKDAKSSLEVYSIVMLASEHKQDVWHANILLAADKDTVVVHDPSDRNGGQAYRRVDRQEFYERWAGAMNKTHLFVVDRL